MKFALAVALLAAVTSAKRTPPKRPTLEEWESGEANATAEDAAVAAKKSKMAAVDKVLQLMTDLRTQVLNEGEAEAQTYNKFACWCKDTSADKAAAIQSGTDELAALDSAIEEKETARVTADQAVAAALDLIKQTMEAMEQAVTKRKGELKVYTANAADLQAALDALTGALNMLKSSKRPQLVQLRSTLHRAALLADALGLDSGLSAFLQQPDVPTEDYKFHSDGIIKTLEKLLDDFRAKKVEVDKTEVAAVAAHDQWMQLKGNFVKLKQEEVEGLKARLASLQEDIALDSERRSTVAATLLDDQEYIKKLADMCRDKAKTWDQRSKVRADELFTLTQVLDIIAGSVSEKTTAKTIRLAQRAVSVRVAQAVASNEGAMEAVEAEAEAADEPPALVQEGKQTVRALRGKQPEDGRLAVAALLKRSGQDLRSGLLSALASKISEDPFAKVKQLIQELIERLLREAGNEANHKGWCDGATSAATQRREYAAEKVEELNGEMARLEGVRDALAEELDELAKAIADLNDARAKAEAMRAEEKKENEKTVQEAQAGLDALTQAMTILDRWYKTNAKEEVDLSLAQQTPEQDAPDAGFDLGEAYKGAQSEAGGIMAMMEVMKSDFARTIMETEAAEAQAQQEHLEFMTETGKSLAQKTTAEEEKTTQKNTAESELSTAEESLETQTSQMNSAVRELLDLKPVCVDTGMSYEERVARREDEIAALHKALCILHAYAEYGPDGAADSC